MGVWLNLRYGCKSFAVQQLTQLRDTAGAERFATLAPLYYRDANAAVIVYDVFDRHSFQSGAIIYFILFFNSVL